MTAGVSASIRSWLEAVGTIAEAVNQAKPLSEILDLISAMTCRQMGYDFCAVLMAIDDPPRFSIQGAAGLSAEYIHRINDTQPILELDGDALEEAPASQAFRSMRPVVTQDIEAEPKYAPWADFGIEEGYRSMLSIPLAVDGVPLGVLTCYAVEKRAFPPTERALVEALAAQAATAIEAARMRDRGQETIAELKRLNATLAAQRDVMERTEALHRELMATALKSPGLRATVDTLSRALGQQVALRGREVPDIAAELDKELGPDERVEVEIVLDGTVVGRLSTNADALEDMAKPFARRALESGALVAGLQLQRERTAEEVHFRLSRDLLGDVLSASDAADEWPIHQRASKLGHDLTRPHTVIVVRADPQSGSGGSQLDPQTVQRRLRSLVEASLQWLTPRPLVAPIRDNVVVLCPMTTGHERTDVRQLAMLLQKRVRESLEPVTVSIAIGAACKQLEGYANAFNVATTALDIRHGTSSENIVSLAQLGAYQFLLQVRHPEQLVQFSAELLDPLRNSERAALLPTLRAYLDNRHSTADTAAALFVHVNTVSYRIRRIEELLDLDLRDPAVLVNLKFALMIDEVLVS